MFRFGRNDGPERAKKSEGLSAPPDFDGPTSQRSCTDVIFALLMLISWGAMTAVGEFASTLYHILIVGHCRSYSYFNL